MDVSEFRSEIKPNITLSADGQDFTVKEVIRFRFDDGSFYIKCFLSNDYVFADDLNTNEFLLVKEIKTQFQQPFSQELNFEGRNFKFLFTAHAVAEEIQGEEIFKKNDSERFWDFKAADGSYLSLGIKDGTNARLDFYGKIVANDSIAFKHQMSASQTYHCRDCGHDGPAFTDEKERPQGADLLMKYSGFLGARALKFVNILTEPTKRCEQCKSKKLTRLKLSSEEK